MLGYQATDEQLTLTARLGVSTSIGGSIPFQNAGNPSVLYILVIQSRIPI